MGDRGPFRFLATAVSGQSNQRRQDRWERSPADEESGQYCSQDGGQHPTEKQHLSGGAVPPIQNQARLAHCDQGHGGQAGPIGVPHAALRDEIRGPRSEVLRDPTPHPTGQTAQVESCQAGISSCPSSRSVTRESFWGEIEEVVRFDRLFEVYHSERLWRVYEGRRPGRSEAGISGSMLHVAMLLVAGFG